MTPHARRRISFLQAALQASSVASLPALTSATSPSHSESGHHKHRHQHQHQHDGNHAKLLHHSHYLPSSRGKKDRNGGEEIGDSLTGDSGSSTGGDEETEGSTEDHYDNANLYNGRPHADVANNELRRRQTAVTEVVQTVSVVQVIDGEGSIITLSTANPPTATQANDISVGISVGATIDSSDPTQTIATGTPAVGATGSTGTSGETSTPIVAASTTGTAVTGATGDSGTGAGLSTTPSTNSVSSEAYTNGTTSGLGFTTSASIPLTTGPSTASLLTAAHNATSNHIFSNSTSLHRTLFGNKTHTSTISTSTHLFRSSSTFSSSLFTTETSSSVAVEATGADGAGGIGGASTDTAAAASPSSTSSDNDSSSTTPPTSVLVGSVIGGLAGLALLLVVAMYLIKWSRKRERNGHKLLGDGEGSAAAAAGAAPRGLPGAGPSGPAGSGGTGGGSSSGPIGSLSGVGMSETRTAFLAPFASALASGQKRISRGTTAPTIAASDASIRDVGGAEGSERSFYRVSGKKLPSVLQHGGDGYEDPRESMISVNTSVYRDSRGYFGGAGGPSTTPTSRYAVGSPMRPESGVPVFHPGPGKVPAVRPVLSRQGSSFQNDAASIRNLTPPPHLDPIGRSLASQDGSRGSGSRFTEDVL